jgi:hypothetical protein
MRSEIENDLLVSLFSIRRKILLAETIPTPNKSSEERSMNLYFQRLNDGAEDSVLLKLGMPSYNLIKLPEEELRSLFLDNFQNFNKVDLILMYAVLECRPEVYDDSLELLIQLLPKDELKAKNEE